MENNPTGRIENSSDKKLPDNPGKKAKSKKIKKSKIQDGKNLGKGINNNLPQNKDLIKRAKELRKAGNLAEVLLWRQLKKGQLSGLDFDRQVVIGNYIVDFYCAQKKIVIEIDESSHDFKTDYDEKRDSFMQGLGLRIIRIADKDVRKNIDDVIEYIKSLM